MASGLVALAVRLIPPHDAYQDLKTGVSSQDIVRGNLRPNNINVSWITGWIEIKEPDTFDSLSGKSRDPSSEGRVHLLPLCLLIK